MKKISLRETIDGVKSRVLRQTSFVRGDAVLSALLAISLSNAGHKDAMHYDGYFPHQRGDGIEETSRLRYAVPLDSLRNSETNSKSASADSLEAKVAASNSDTTSNLGSVAAQSTQMFRPEYMPDDSTLAYDIDRRASKKDNHDFNTIEKKVNKYNRLIKSASQEYNIPEEVIKGLIYTESKGREKVVSRSGAIGLMQITPETGTGLGVTRNQLKKPEYNIPHGVRYFSELLDEFDGNYVLALAAYNVGLNNVKRKVSKFRDKGSYEDITWGQLKPHLYRETKGFVVEVFTAAAMFSHNYVSYKPGLTNFKEL